VSDYFYVLFAFAFACAMMEYLPIVADRLKISYTVPLLFAGVFFYYVGVPIEWPTPLWPHKWVKIVTEVIVIISLMSAGLKIGLQYELHYWKKPLRLIHTSMPLYMLGIYLLAHYILHFDNPSSVLLAAVCAPTDPVLASDLQLQEDDLGSRKNTGMRYLLTAEAGINDGVAFPFVFLAILWSKGGSFQSINLLEWISYYFTYKIVAGVVVGALLGYLYSLSIEKIKSRYDKKVLSGFVGVAMAFLSFASAELVNSYGFLAAFCTGLFAQYHNHVKGKDNHNSEILVFNEEVEKLLIVLWTLLFGGFLASGILSYSNAASIGTALFLVFILRPVCGRLGLAGTGYSEKKKWAIGYFGIKGVGSFFYLAYALHEGQFSNGNELYALVSLLVLISIFAHGLTGPRVIDYFDKNNPG